MKKISIKRWVSVAATALVACGALSSGVFADTGYPRQPIKFILGFGPGSTTDTIARTAGQRMAAPLGQPIIVENRPGALSTLATEFVARAKPDGYSVLIAANAGLSAAPAGLMRSVRYDPTTDFEPVGGMIESPFLLVVDPKLGVSTLAELVALMKSDPSKRSCSSGNASTRIYCELFKRNSGVDLAIVPFKSSPESTMAVMSGQVAMQFLDLASAMPRIRSGQMKAVASMTRARIGITPDLPTATEAGWTGTLLGSGWIAMLVPAKTPPSIVERLNKELNAALEQPEFRSRLEQDGFQVTSGPPSALRTKMTADLQQWKTLIRELNLEPEG